MVLIDSVYINKSGGKVLLEYIIKSIIDKKIERDFYFLFDKRIKISTSVDLHLLTFEYLVPSEKSRREFYKKSIDAFSLILCFANVPPPITIKDKKVLIYFHNVLLANIFKANLSILDVIILSIKKKYIKLVNRYNYTWITQSEVIKKILVDKIGVNGNMIKVLPFFNISKFQSCNTLIQENYNNYLYVADSSKQKNHLRLLNAWEKFTQNPENTHLTLHLTLPDANSRHLLDKIEFLKSKGCKIVNHKDCSFDRISQLYQNCNYLIFPSLAESFGLPLIEAASSGCKIIASDLPYVYNVVKPSLVFNPYDEQSIIFSLNASRDYMNIRNSKLVVKNKLNQIINILKYV